MTYARFPASGFPALKGIEIKLSLCASIRVNSRFKTMNQISELYQKWNGLILILAGIYAVLLGGGILPIKFGHPDYSEKWQKKYGGIMKYLGLMAILAGISSLLFGFYS
jgi:hypothetical protein